MPKTQRRTTRQKSSTVSADPIFELIDAYKAANKQCRKLFAEQNALEDRLPEEKRSWRASVFEPVPPAGCKDAPEWLVNQACYRDASNIEARALVGLVLTAPTTTAGAAALMNFAVEFSDDVEVSFAGKYDPNNGQPIYFDIGSALHKTMAKALAKLATQSPF